MKLRKTIISAILLIALTACSNAKLVEQAETHYANNEYTSAFEAYSKALDKKEDAETRNAYTALKSEIDRIHTVNKLRADLKLAVTNYVSTLSLQDLIDICDEIDGVTAQIDTFDTSVKDEVSTYVNKLRESSEYTALKSHVLTVRITTAAGMTDVAWVTDAKQINENVSAVLAKPTLPHGYADVN